MTLNGRLVLILLGIVFVPGCVAPPTSVGTRPVRPVTSSIVRATPAPIASVAPLVPPGLFPAPVSSLAPAAPLLSNNGASLGGTVMAPASIISNNGGGYRLANVPVQVPVAGVVVRLMDAAGQLVTGADGKPVEAVTDPAGAYRFADVPPGRSAILTAELPNDRGAVRALLTRDGTERLALNLDYVSTLATVYVLEKYVGTQTDRVATLDKLPAAMEAETRSRTSAALTATSTQVPPTLNATALVAAVEALRGENVALSTQLDAVRRLLIPAGQSDLGAGRLGTEVTLSGVSMLLAQPDGTLVVAAEGDRRLWRLDLDGRLRTVAGSGSPSADSIDGATAERAGLVAPTGVLRDAAGRLVMLEKAYADYPIDRVTRLESNGTVSELWYDSRRGVAVFPGSGDEVLVLRSGMLNEPAELVAIAADRTRTVRQTLSTPNRDIVRALQAYGQSADGTIWLGTASEVHTLNPTTGVMTRVMSRATDGLLGLSVDAVGNLFYVDAAHHLTVRTPAGVTRVLLDAWPSDVDMTMAGVALMPDGTACIARNRSVVYRVAGNVLTVVAGVASAPSTQAGDLALAGPSGVAPIAGGGMFVADETLHRILRIAVDGSVTPVAGTGEVGASGDGGPAIAAKLDMPRTLRTDAAGNLYLLDNQAYETYRICKIGLDGRLSTLYTSDRMISDYVVAADGTVYLADYLSVGFLDSRVTLKRITPDGVTTTIVDEAIGFSNTLSLALGLDDTLFALNAGSQVLAWFPDKGLKLTTVGSGKSFLHNNESGFAIDKDLRFYFADNDDHTVIRWDPKLKAFETVAGVGGTHFSGTGVDDGLVRPGHLSFDAAGNLYIVDAGHKQVKRVPVGELH